MPTVTITPEQQLRHLIEETLRATAVVRQHTGQGRPPQYVARVDVIAQTARHLAELVEQYLDGTLAPIVCDADDVPF